MPRRKKNRYTRIAREIECLGEYCGPCGLAYNDRDEGLVCDEFGKSLAPVGGDRRAERCSDCHMAERVANGEKIA